jgi:hypothetical protein
MAILKVNNCGDPVGTANPITLSSNVVTTASWPSAPANMPNVASPDILKLSVEPSTPNEEILYVTAYTSGATSATVTRAQEGSTARTHPATAWVHGPTAADFSPMTLAGDMEIGGANGALTRLPVGANGYIMAASSGAPAWIPLTTQPGDLVVGQNPGGATTLLRLGPNGTVLTVSGGTANWVAPVDSGWQQLALSSPWANFGAPYRPLSARLLGPVVHLDALVSLSASATGASTIATVPSNMYPPYEQIFWVQAAGTGWIRLDIYASGAIVFNAYGSSVVPSGTWVSLAGIAWFAN